MISLIRTSRAENATRHPIAQSVQAQFIGVGLLFLLGLIPLSVALTGGFVTLGMLVGLGFYGLALLVGVRALSSYPHGSIGLCNAVTVFRLMLISGLIAALVTSTAGPWPIFAIALLALMLDGLDGWFARRSGLASEFGARFDMEVDAVLAIVLAFHAFLGGHVGAFILLLGLPRYAFWVAQFKMPWLNAELPPRFSRKVVCVVQISVLIAVLVPTLGRPLTDIVAGATALALIWSFWLDIRWLWRARP